MRGLNHLARRFGIARALGLALTGLFLAVRAADPLPVEILRLKVFDLYQNLKPRAPERQPIAIVDIDEKSLAELGQWPWPRTLVAELVSQLGAYGATAVAFDVVFPEPDRTSLPKIAEQRDDLPERLRDMLRAQPGNDEVFAEAIARHPVALGQSGHPQPRGDERRPAEPVPVAFLGEDPRPMLYEFAGLIRNIPVLEAAARGRGMITLVPDSDGLVRRVPAMVRVDDTALPALSLELLRLGLDASTYVIKADEAGIREIVIGNLPVPTDRTGRIWVNYAERDPAKYVSAVDVLRGDAATTKLFGKLVLVGTSAVGLLDIKATPLEAALPGVEVHAHILESILTRSNLIRPHYALGAELVLIAAGSGLIILLVPLLGALPTFLLGATLAGTLVAGSWALYADAGILIDVAFALVSSFLVYVLLVFFNYLREETQRRKVRAAFSQYLSPALVERLAEHPDRLVLGGEMREMTVLFSDVRGFTTIAEQYSQDPQGLTSLMNRLLTPLTNDILRNAGTIDKYMGDAVMAFWNAPLDDADHAIHACQAALDMRSSLAALNESRRKEAAGGTFHLLDVGVGLNTGACVVGNMGSDQRFDYSVIGDPVNLGARLEGSSKLYGVEIVVGWSTTDLASGRFAFLELDRIRVKGKMQPEVIHALLGDRRLADSPEFQALVGRHGAMLEAYRSQDWEAALEACRHCRGALPELGLETLYDLYEERIALFKEDPPAEDWDGVFVAETK